MNSRRNGSANMPDGIRLDSHILKNRVAEVVAARLKEPWPPYPIVGKEIVVIHHGPVSNLDVEFVRGLVESKFWECAKELCALGIDPAVGDFSVTEGDIGNAPDGAPAVRFMLLWKPKEAR